jgi:putative oxidoreductase
VIFSEDLIGLIGAVILTAPYWVSAVMKAYDFTAAALEIMTFGLPFPKMTAVAVICLQSVGSIFVIAGFHAWLAVAALIVFTALASIKGHGFWRFQGHERLSHLNACLANLGLSGGLLLAALVRSQN